MLSTFRLACSLKAKPKTFRENYCKQAEIWNGKIICLSSKRKFNGLALKIIIAFLHVSLGIIKFIESSYVFSKRIIKYNYIIALKKLFNLGLSFFKISLLITCKMTLLILKSNFFTIIPGAYL